MNTILIRVPSQWVVVKNRSAAAAVAAEVERPRSGSSKRVLLRATLFTPHGAYTVWIRDISPSGALVTSGDRLPADCDVILKRGDFFAAARLAGFNDVGAEVSFYRNLDEDEIASAVQQCSSSGG